MMTLGQLLSQQRLDDAIVSLLEVRVPFVIGDLDFYDGTWKGLPIHPKEMEQLADIANSLTQDEQVVIKLSAILVNWGRKYEIQRLLQVSGNFSPSKAVEGVSGGKKTVGESNHFVAESNNFVAESNNN